MNTTIKSIALEQIDAFTRYYRHTPGHLVLAKHASFPLALTPDYLYRLRQYLNHKPNSNYNIPWVAVSDLLLSSLCWQIGKNSELYEMDREIRLTLLAELDLDTKHELAKFSLDYIERHFDSYITDLRDAQHWIALAYVRSKDASHKLQQKIQQLLAKPDRVKWLRTRDLIASVDPSLRESGDFAPLVHFVNEKVQSLTPNNPNAIPTLSLTPHSNLHQWVVSAVGLESVVEPSTVRLESVVEPSTVGLESVVEPSPMIKLVPVKSFDFETVTVDKKGQIINREKKLARYLTEDLGDGIILEMVEIPGGTFLMGAPDEEGASGDEKPQHEVTLGPFFMAKYPITQAQWRAVVKMPIVTRDLKPNPSYFKGDQRPVENVNWLDAVEFCARLSKYTGKDYGLPSESQWEYACRAGTTTPFYFGETITPKLVNYDGNYRYGDAPKGEYRQKTTDVGIFPPNSFGLYDMHGNVWEWCADEWHKNYEGAPTDGSAWIEDDIHSQLDRNAVDKKINFKNKLEEKINIKSNKTRLLRGGSWGDLASNCRSAYRLHYSAVNADDYFGFRVALSWPCASGA